jgi:predicted transcriptional regulator
LALSLIGDDGLDHPSVQRVIKIAEEIINQNIPLTTENLYSTAKSKLKLSRRGLISIIQLLFNRKILVEGSKFTKNTVLTNQFRRLILNYVKTNIGAHFSDIRKEIMSDKEGTGSSGQLIWHLEMLIKFKFIKKMKVGNYTIFLPINLDEDIGLISFLMKDPINKKILEKLVELDTIPQSIFQVFFYLWDPSLRKILNLYLRLN